MSNYLQALLIVQEFFPRAYDPEEVELGLYVLNSHDPGTGTLAAFVLWARGFEGGGNYPVEEVILNMEDPDWDEFRDDLWKIFNLVIARVSAGLHTMGLDKPQIAVSRTNDGITHIVGFPPIRKLMDISCLLPQQGPGVLVVHESHTDPDQGLLRMARDASHHGGVFLGTPDTTPMLITKMRKFWEDISKDHPNIFVHQTKDDKTNPGDYLNDLCNAAMPGPPFGGDQGIIVTGQCSRLVMNPDRARRMCTQTGKPLMYGATTGKTGADDLNNLHIILKDKPLTPLLEVILYMDPKGLIHVIRHPTMETARVMPMREST